MIFQIDCKIAEIPVNDLRKNDEIQRQALKIVDGWAEKNKWEFRVIRELDLVHTSPENRELIKKILQSPNSNFELHEKKVNEPEN